jgi:hypothetical protein
MHSKVFLALVFAVGHLAIPLPVDNEFDLNVAGNDDSVGFDLADTPSDPLENAVGQDQVTTQDGAQDDSVIQKRATFPPEVIRDTLIKSPSCFAFIQVSYQLLNASSPTVTMLLQSK